MKKDISALKKSIMENVNSIKNIISENIEAPIEVESTEALKALDEKISEVKETYINTFENKIKKLKNDIEKAKEKEDFQQVLTSQPELEKAMAKLILAKEKELEYLRSYKLIISQSVGEIQEKGSGVFKNRELPAIMNDTLAKGNTIEIQTKGHKLRLEKINDGNQYKVISVTIPGFIAGDVVTLPTEGIKIGFPATLKLYRKLGDRMEEISAPGKGTTIQNIYKIIKNPS